MRRQLHRLVRPLDRGEGGAPHRVRVAAQHREAEMGAVGDAPQVDPGNAERPTQVLQIVGALGGVIAFDRHRGAAPARDAIDQSLAMISSKGRLVQPGGGIERPRRGAGRDVIGQTGPALIEQDDVGDLAKREKDRLAGAARRSDAGSARAAGEIDDRRARLGIGRAEADEADVDPARGGVRPVLGHREGAALGGQLAAVGELEDIGLDPKRCRSVLRHGRGREQKRRSRRDATEKPGHIFSHHFARSMWSRGADSVQTGSVNDRRLR